MSSIIVDNDGTRLTFTDSGAPPDFRFSYVTIFAVHGIEFTAGIFQNVQSLAPAAGIRFVSINRRGYTGSTPFSAEELVVLNNGTDAEKDQFLKARGLEILNFMDIFMQQNETRTFSASGEGGIALLGWSLGNSLTLAAISHFESLPSDAQSRLGPQMRALIMQEPPSVSIGADSPPQIWSPQIDTSIPEDTRLPMFTQWITSYFHHGEISTRNTGVISYVLPATFHAPSIFNMTSSQIKTTKALWPNMRIWEVVGDATCSFPLTGLFSLQNDNDARGGGFIHFNIIHNANHFMHWDEPDRAIEAYLKALA